MFGKFFKLESNSSFKYMKVFLKLKLGKNGFIIVVFLFFYLRRKMFFINILIDFLYVIG